MSTIGSQKPDKWQSIASVYVEIISSEIVLTRVRSSSELRVLSSEILRRPLKEVDSWIVEYSVEI